MRASFLLLLLLIALINPLVQSAHQTVPRPMSEPQVASPEIFILANATVNWYNNKTNSHIVLFNVTGGFVQFYFDRDGQHLSFDVLVKVHYDLGMDVLVPKPNCTSFALKHYWGSVDDYSPKQDRTVLDFLGVGEGPVQSHF